MKIGNLNDCDCGGDGADLGEIGDFEASYKPPPAGSVGRKKPRKKRSQGTGAFCVTSHKGKVVHCYDSSAVAERVAKAFTSRGKAGTKFHVSKRDR